jgi:hypothetical protein
VNDVFASLSKWMKANKLTLNFDKTNFMKFSTNNKTCVNLNIGYDDKTIEEIETAKIPGPQIDNNQNWKTLIQCIIPKLSSTCFEDIHITHENINFKISLLCLLSFQHVIWNNFLGKFNRPQKKYFTSKRK